MSSTILMVIVLVVMWLVVLVPMFVRRHDESTEARSMERFASTMRVLSRRAHAAARSAATSRPSMPSRSGRAAEVAAEADAAATVEPTSAAAALTRAEGRRRMLARRRRTLAGLSGLLAVGLVGAVALSGVLWVVTAAAGLLLGGYVSWLRQQVRRAHERAVRRAAVFSRTTPSQPAHAAAQPAYGPGRHAIRPGRTIRASRRRAAAAAAAEAAEITATPAAARTWEPTPVPAPLYVGKAVAPPVPESVVALDDEDPSFAEIETATPAAGHRRAANE